MRITVHLHTILVLRNAQGIVSQLEIDVPEACAVEHLIQRLNIPLPLEALMLAVNGRVATDGQRLQDGDQINIMPAISGGGEN
jgi:sulfur carrier protein ThiS